MPIFKITYKGKDYPYTITHIEDGVSRMICKEAKIDQEFLNEDFFELLQDLPHLIQAEKEYKKSITEVVRFRVNRSEKILLQKKAHSRGFKNMSAFLRKVALGA